MGKIMNKAYQMSELEHNAFIEHCKSSEIYKKVQLRKGFLDEEPSQDSMAWIDWSNHHDEDPESFFVGKNGQTYWVYETKEIKVKGYNNGKEKRWVNFQK
tara:strand:- start:192 stop:491 length:300 start_codon:yes stop_codon:yes gene_type:complete